MTTLPNINSYTLRIRDGLLTRLALVPTFATGIARFGRSRARVVQSEHIPYLGCYLVSENMTGDGDSNHAEPRFTHRVVYGFSYIIQNIDPDEAEDELDRGHWAIMALLHDPSWHTFPLEAGETEPLRIEAVAGGDRHHLFGNIGNNTNETPIAEMRMEWTCLFRSSFEPIVDDLFETFHATTRLVPWADDPDSRQEIISEYQLKQ